MEKMARWRAKHPEAGLYTKLQRLAKKTEQPLHFTRKELGALWESLPHHFCELCNAPADFAFGGGYESQKRMGGFTRRNLLGHYTIDNMMLVCAPCSRRYS